MHTIPCCDVVNVWLWGAANFTACLVNAKLENAIEKVDRNLIRYHENREEYNQQQFLH